MAHTMTIKARREYSSGAPSVTNAEKLAYMAQKHDVLKGGKAMARGGEMEREMKNVEAGMKSHYGKYGGSKNGRGSVVVSKGY